MNLSEQLRKALDLWIELTGVDPAAKSFQMKLGGGMDSYTISTMHKAIRDALDLDETNITGHLLLDALSTRYFKERSFSIFELMENPAQTAEYVEKAKAFTELSRSPEIRDISEQFALSLRTAVRQYGMDTEAVMTLLDDHHELAYLRRDALRSMQNLRVDQFLRGVPEDGTVKPVYNGVVHQFWNANSLVQAACGLPSGVTLNLVRDPDDMQSFFAFTIRNGGNLYLLSDVPVHAHPLQRYMARRPERSFAERTVRNWFPYDLLNLKYDEEAKVFFADQAKRHSLIPLQQEVDKLKPIADLDPQEIVWLVMMFDLIVTRFWTSQYQAPALSYTGQMIREDRPLINAAERANLPVANYPVLALTPLTVEDVRCAANNEKAVGKDGGAINTWLEDRYAGQVDEATLNLLDGSNQKHYLPPHAASKRATDHVNHELSTQVGSVVSVNPAADEKLPFWSKEGRYALHAFDATSFGSREEIENNRLFVARHNMAKAIQRLANEEFARREGEIKGWFMAAIKKNADYLLQLAAQGTVVRDFDASGFPGAELRSFEWHTKHSFNFMSTYTKENRPQFSGWGFALNLGYNRKSDGFLCYITGAISTYQVSFRPQTARDLAEMAGCAINELPDVLQHWAAKKDHDGNHLLNRIDPMAWALDDPWQHIDFSTVIHLSKRGMASIKKTAPPTAQPPSPPPGLKPYDVFKCADDTSPSEDNQ
jgi:hypothetical protein